MELQLIPRKQDSLQIFMSKVPQINMEEREKIIRFEEVVKKLPQHECKITNYFIDGIYVREIFIPQGCVLVGYIHMFPCITTISKGCILIADGDGFTKELRAPFTTAVPAGTKKAGYALEDTIWCDAYLNPDNEMDIDKLESRLTANTHAEFLEKTKERFLLNGDIS